MNKAFPNFVSSLVKLIFISTAVRIFLAAIFELSNDEVYYWLYARYPDWSHYDHPPMVGLLIQISTFNLHFDAPFFIRFGSVLLSALNTWIIYKTGKLLGGKDAGWIAALLYTSSLYTSLIAGVFILPDSPQLFFILLGQWFYLQAFSEKSYFGSVRVLFPLAGLFYALAMSSKYHSIFFVAAVAFYGWFIDKRWRVSKSFNLSILISSFGI